MNYRQSYSHNCDMTYPPAELLPRRTDGNARNWPLLCNYENEFQFQFHGNSLAAAAHAGNVNRHARL